MSRRTIAISLLLAMFGAAPTAEARQMSFLDNGIVKVGTDLDEGGAISFVSPTGGGDSDNVVNDHDLGRLVQQSYYAGPEGLGEPCFSFGTFWNPIGGGDCYGHPSTVLESSNDGATIYVKSRPLQWAFNNVPCECVFEHWITLDRNAVLVRNRLTNARADRQLYEPLGQELPAVYTNGRLGRLVAYGGRLPWTGGRLNAISADLPAAIPFVASERWAAHVDRSGFGLGVFNPQVTTFIGGFHGARGIGGSRDDNTGYVSPTRLELLDWNIVYDYDYALVLGTIAAIREYAGAHRPPDGPNWRFDSGRSGFRYVNTSDSGFPVQGVLNVRLDRRDPQLWSPPTFWRAEDVPAVEVRMALHGTNATQGELFWGRFGGGFSSSQRTTFAVIPDGNFHVYRVPLAAITSYSGAITSMRLDPINTAEQAGAYAEIDSITAVLAEPAAHPRVLRLSLAGKFGVGRLSAPDGYMTCAGNAPVVVARRTGRSWRQVGSTLTTEDGRYRIRIRGRGSFRARAPALRRNGHTCRSAASAVRRRRSGA